VPSVRIRKPSSGTRSSSLDWFGGAESSTRSTADDHHHAIKSRSAGDHHSSSSQVGITTVCHRRRASVWGSWPTTTSGDYCQTEDSARGGWGKRIRSRLTKDDHFFHANPRELSQSIVITSYGTLASRHGPVALKQWRKENGLFRGASVFTVPDPQWPADLSGCFLAIILDEVHLVKNIEAHATMVVVPVLSLRQDHVQRCKELGLHAAAWDVEQPPGAATAM